MSIELMTAVWKNGPSKQTERFVLLSLADQANDAGHCWPSYAKTAERCCMNRRSVMRIVQRLQDEGWLQAEPRFTVGARRTSNGVWLNLTKLFDGDRESPLQHCNGDTGSPGVVTHGHQGGDTGSPEPSINPNIQPDDGDDEFERLLAEFGIDPNARTRRLAGRAYITREFLAELVDEATRKGMKTGWVVTQLEKGPRPMAVKCDLCGGRHERAACPYQEVIQS